MAVTRDEAAVRLKLERAQQFKRGMDDAAGSLRKFGKDARWSAAGAKMASNGMKSLKSAGGMLTHGLIRGGQAAGLAVGAIGLMALKSGIQFNSTMQQNQIAFTKFLGSADKANKFLSDLYVLAKETPFEFTQLTSASQKLLAFGFSAKETKRTLKDLADVASGMGKSGEDIDRMVLAIGQIQAKGKLQGDEMLQLTESGIPALQVISKAIGKSTTETSKMITKGEVSSKTAIDAILAYSEKKFGGMSAKQSKTLMGQWSTMKDNWAQLTGALTTGLTKPLTKGMTDANAGLSKLTAVFKRKDWNIERKLRVSRRMVEDFFRPYIRRAGRFIADMHLDQKLHDAVEAGAPMVINALAAAAPRAAGMFVHAFMSAGAWGKFLTVAFLLHKMGAFSAVGSVVAKKFAARFIATAGAEVAAEAGAAAIATSFAGALALALPAALIAVGLAGIVMAALLPESSQDGKEHSLRKRNSLDPTGPHGPDGTAIYNARTGNVDPGKSKSHGKKTGGGNFGGAPIAPLPSGHGHGRGSSAMERQGAHQTNVYLDGREVGTRMLKRTRDRARRK